MIIGDRKSLSSSRAKTTELIDELRRSTPLESMKASFQRQIQKEEKYRVGVLRNVATFGRLRSLRSFVDIL